MLDSELRRAIKDGDTLRARILMQRSGQRITWEPGDLIEIGPDHDYLGTMISDRWLLKCPVIAVVVSYVEGITPAKVIDSFNGPQYRPATPFVRLKATLPPPYSFNAQNVGLRHINNPNVGRDVRLIGKLQ